ncbi:hypothetical protein V499_00799 [Pseudogymnoascus sp. VKM F-103]|nr:hypothetical protein V499_00799 [Pseudogymnoascus sp. VKM F-103]
MGTRYVALALIALAAASLTTLSESELQKRATTLIPCDVFDSVENLETYFYYGYPPPYYDVHDGGARMAKSQVTIVDSRDGPYLQLNATPKAEGVGPPKFGNISLEYISGTITSYQNFVIAPGGRLDMQADFITPVLEGCWEDWWLTGADDKWPPEIDMAEWRGEIGSILSFNLFNDSVTSVAHNEFPYPNPDEWHTVRADMRALEDNITVKVDYFLDGIFLQSQWGNMTGEPMVMILDYQMLAWGGSPGPDFPTFWKVKNLSVVSYDP